MGGNVLLRYVFHTGSVWSQELEWHLMAPICLFGMSYALRHGEHVRVDVMFAALLRAQQASRRVHLRAAADGDLPDRHLAVLALRDAVLGER